MSTGTAVGSGHRAAREHAVASSSADQRVAGALLGFGAVLLAVGNGLHPVDADPSATSRLLIADAGSWIPVHLVLATGFLTVATGIAALAATFRNALALAVGRVAGMVALVGGTLLFAVFGGLDGHAFSSLAQDGSSAGHVTKDVLEPAAVTINVVDTGIAAMGTLALLGLALLLLGGAVRADRHLSPWWAGMAAVLGVGGTIAGAALVSVGATTTTINVLLRPIGLATTIYFLALGVTLWRAQPRP